MGFGKGKGFSPVIPPALPSTGVQSNDCQREHSIDQGYCHEWNAPSQTFTPDHDYIAVGLDLLLTQYDIGRKGPLIVKLELPAANCWEAEVIWSQALYSTDLPLPGDYRWTHFVLPNISLTKDAVYRITVHTTPGWYSWNGEAWVLREDLAAMTWRAYHIANLYPRGSKWQGCNYRDKSAQWEPVLEHDRAFCVYEPECPPPGPIDREVKAGTDDCFTFLTTIQLTYTYLSLDLATQDVHAYARFLSIPLYKGFIINKAYIDLRSMSNYVGSSSLRILGIKQANTATFSTQANADGRPVTNAYVDWTPGNWDIYKWYGRTNDPQDITAIIQEIINQAAWAFGNALAIKIINTARGITRWGSSFESGYPPRLYIEYTIP